jgi:MFS family permease
MYFELLFVGFLLDFGYSMLRSFLPIFVRELDPAGVLVGFSISSYFFGRVFIELPSGFVADRIGRMMPIRLGLCLSTIGVLICAFSMSIYVLILGLTLWGLGTALFYTNSTTLIIDFFKPSMRGRALGTFQGIEFIGSFAGAPLGALLAEHYGYRSVFYVTGSSIATAFLVAFALRGLKHISTRSIRKPMRTPIRETLDGLKNWGLLATCVTSFSRVFINQGVISTIFPIYLHDFLKMSVGLIGIIIGVRTVGLCLATFSCGHLSDRVGRKPVIFAGIAIESLCIYLYALASFLEFILLLAFVEGLGAGMISTALIALMSEQVAPEHAGGAVGLYRTFIDIGAVTGPILIMMIQTSFGIYAGFLFGATLLLVNVPALLPVRESHP